MLIAGGAGSNGSSASVSFENSSNFFHLQAVLPRTLLLISDLEAVVLSCVIFFQNFETPG